MILLQGARFEDYMFEKLDRQTPLRPSNSFCLGQTMAYAGKEIGPGIEYGMIVYLLLENSTYNFIINFQVILPPLKKDLLEF